MRVGSCPSGEGREELWGAPPAALPGHREGEGEPRAQALADGETQSRASKPARSLRARLARILREQVRQEFRRHAPAFVGHRYGHQHAIAHRADPDGGRLRRVPGGIGEQVVQDLHDTLAVRVHAGQIGRIDSPEIELRA